LAPLAPELLFHLQEDEGRDPSELRPVVFALARGLLSSA
jgi:hypothetical protein